MERKPQNQPALASLSPDDKELLVEWLRKGEYDDVLERIKKPRPEGFGLHISRKPLQTFYAKVALLDLINSRVASEKKMTIAYFESLAAGDLLLSGAGVSAADSGVPPESAVHDAIMSTVYDLATSGDNTPTQLLALQRLADFPARAEYREHKRQLELRKEQFAGEKHAHKVAVDQERAAHKLDMDEHRKRMNEERLALANRSFQLRERQLALKAASTQSRNKDSPPFEDALGPLATNWDEVEARAKKKFGPIPVLDNPDSTPPDLTSPENQDPTTENPVTPASAPSAENSPSPLPPVPAPSSVLPASAPQCQIDLVSRSEQQLEPQRGSAPKPTVATEELPWVCNQENSNTNGVAPPPAPGSALPAPGSALPAPGSALPAPSSLHDRVSQYTLDRHYEALEGKDVNKVGRWASWKFKTKLQHCPCGNHVPCPEHGDFPPRFWQMTPDESDYFAILTRKNLPYTDPQTYAKQLARKALLAKLPPLDPAALFESSKVHAIKRWRCYTPRPRGIPFPDESWITQCPCGAELPCDYHDDLARRFRYIKPWDKDYIAALQAEDIPVYTPPQDIIDSWSKPVALNQENSSTNGVAPAATAAVTTLPAPGSALSPPTAAAASNSAESLPKNKQQITENSVTQCQMLNEPPSPPRPPIENGVVPDTDYDEFKEAFAKLTPEELFLRYYGDE